MQAACCGQEGIDQWQRPDAAAAREPSPDESHDMLEGPCKCQMSLGAMGEQPLCSPGGLCTCCYSWSALTLLPQICVSSCCARLAARAPALYPCSTLSVLLEHLHLPLFFLFKFCCCCWETILRQLNSLCITLCCVGYLSHVLEILVR